MSLVYPVDIDGHRRTLADAKRDFRCYLDLYSVVYVNKDRFSAEEIARVERDLQAILCEIERFRNLGAIL